MHVYETRNAALAAKWAVAQAMGCTKADLVVVRSSHGYRLVKRETLERWLRSK